MHKILQMQPIAASRIFEMLKYEKQCTNTIWKLAYTKQKHHCKIHNENRQSHGFSPRLKLIHTYGNILCELIQTHKFRITWTNSTIIWQKVWFYQNMMVETDDFTYKITFPFCIRNCLSLFFCACTKEPTEKQIKL